MRIFLTILIFFILAQLLGVYTGVMIINDLNQNPYVSSLVVASDTEAPSNAFFFMAYVLLGAVSMIILIRIFKEIKIIFRIIEFLLIAMSSSIVFYAFLRLVLNYDISTSSGIILGLLFSASRLFFSKFNFSIKNAAAVLSTAGVGVIFGISLGVVPVIIFLLLLSLYDYLSVFKTKHMIELADFVMEKNLAFTITAVEPRETKDEKERRIDLGTGDMIAPVMMEVSALTIGFIASFFVFVGAIVSMAAFLYLIRNKKIILPALPPIVFGMLVFFVMGMLMGFY